MSRRRQRTGAAARCRAAPVFNCIAVQPSRLRWTYVARARSFTRPESTGYMRARSARSVLTGDAVFVILWDAKATVPLGTALSNVHKVHAEALYRAPHGSRERSATTSKPEQGRGPCGEGQLSLRARAEQAPSRTTPPVPRTTAAPRASRRRDESTASATATKLELLAYK